MSSATEAKRWMTADELAGWPDDEFQYELDEGELIIMAPAGELHGRAEIHRKGRAPGKIPADGHLEAPELLAGVKIALQDVIAEL